MKLPSRRSRQPREATGVLDSGTGDRIPPTPGAALSPTDALRADRAPPGEESASIRDRIARRAYAHFEARGCCDGCDFDDWLLAEREVLGELAAGECDENRGQR